MNRKKKSKKNKSPSNQIAKIPSGSGSLPPIKLENSQQISEIQLQQLKLSHGPIPSPEILQQYENLQPGLATKIIEWADQEKNHRHSIEKTGQEANIQEIRTGQNYGLIIGVITIISGSVTAIMGAEVAGGFIGTGGVVGLVATFVYGRKPK